MRLSSLAWRDWQRRPLRTCVTAAGVGIAIAALYSLLAFQRGYEAGLRSELDRLGAQVLVVPKGCPYDAASVALHGASWSCFLKAAYLKEVQAVTGVAAAAPVFMNAFYETNGAQVVYEGIDPTFLRLKPGWRLTGRFPESKAEGSFSAEFGIRNSEFGSFSDSALRLPHSTLRGFRTPHSALEEKAEKSPAHAEILIGSEAARRRGWRLGQTVALPALADHRATISGVLAPTHDAEDDFIFLSLASAQRLFGHPGELTHILVRLTDPNHLENVVSQLRGCEAGLDMNVVPLAHLFRSIQTLVNSTRVWLGCVALVGLLVAGAGVANAILMAVAERTREIGVLRALGAARRDIFVLFWWETVQVCCAGCVVGVGAAYAAASGVEAWLRGRLPFAPADPLVQWQWPLVAACFGCALLLGSLAGFLPAWRAACLSPMSAMRSQ